MHTHMNMHVGLAKDENLLYTASCHLGTFSLEAVLIHKTQEKQQLTMDKQKSKQANPKENLHKKLQ